MKKHIRTIILFAIALISSFQLTFAQKITTGIHIINNNKYNVSITYDSSYFVLSIINPPYIPENKEVIDGLNSDILGTKYLNWKEWEEMIISTLPKEKVNQLIQRKEKMDAFFTFQPTSGKIYYITYGLYHNTIFTLEDLSKIDKKLRRDFRFRIETFKSRHLQLNYIRTNHELKFSKLKTN